MRIGLIINPIAGMGGRVGLKGTDGEETLRKALELGAEPKAAERARQALNQLIRLDVEWVTWGGDMGENLFKEMDFRYTVLGSPKQEKTTSKDTREAAKAMLETGVSLIIFVGGDGTAVDIVESVDKLIPVLGIPSGVKMYSAVFAVTPRAASELIRGFVKSETSSAEREVMDIDEEAYRMGRLEASLKGYAVTPFKSSLILSEKIAGSVADEDLMKASIADRVVEEMNPGALYILGPGSTVKAITERLGIKKTLLGVDLVRDGELVALDVNEKTILEYLGNESWIIVSPLGGQGSLFGHGNQQISPNIIRKVGIDNIIIVSTSVKLQGLNWLVVDTGDPDLDERLRGYRRVITSLHETRLVRVI